MPVTDTNEHASSITLSDGPALLQTAESNPSPGRALALVPEPRAAAEPAPALAVHLESAAAAVRASAAAGLPAPQAITITEGGVTAQCDTEVLLAWGAVMFSSRPQVSTYPGSPYVLAAGDIAGTPWRLHNGYAPPRFADEQAGAVKV